MKKTIKENTVKSIVRILMFLVVAGALFFFLERDKVKRLETNIMNFQKEYKQYIAQDSSVDLDMLNNLSKSRFFGSDVLAKYYENFKTSTFKNFKKDYLAQLYNFNFLKNQNIKNYTNANSQAYKDMISKNDKLIQELEKDYKVNQINLMKENNEKLEKIAIEEINYDRLVIKEFKKALKNDGTTNNVLNNCFEKQENDDWQYDEDTSRTYCYKLGLQSCKMIFSNVNANDGMSPFYGFTMNNPRKISNSTSYLEYISYRKDDFRTNDYNVFGDTEKDNIIYPEVYTKEVFGRKIYKYNVATISKAYRIGCEFPNK